MDNNTTTLMDAQGGLFSGSFNIERLKTFYTVMQMGSIYQASRRLGLSQPAVSRQITTLEQSLGVLLFHRGLGGVTPTRYGEILYESAEKILAESHDSRAKIEQERNEMQGEIKLATTVTLSIAWLPDMIGEFAEQHKKLDLIVRGSNFAPNLSVGEADALIWTKLPKDHKYAETKLMSFRGHLYASKEYLEKHGTPQKPEDLARHRLLAYGPANRDVEYDIDWHLRLGRMDGKMHRPFMRLDNRCGLYELARKGRGIILLSEEFHKSYGEELVKVLPEVYEKGPELYFYTTKENMKTRKIKELLGHLLREMAQ